MKHGLVFQSQIGRVGIEAGAGGVTRIMLRPTKRELSLLARAAPSPESLRLRRQLERYFADEPVRFDVALDLSSGTPFQRRVWRACRRIPYGETRSYGELAHTAGCPRGARAAGGAMGANPLPIAIPCHRVICADGSLGGYGLGLPLKRTLLRIEGVI